jgi:hypothetical protein
LPLATELSGADLVDMANLVSAPIGVAGTIVIATRVVRQMEPCVVEWVSLNKGWAVEEN